MENNNTQETNQQQPATKVSGFTMFIGTILIILEWLSVPVVLYIIYKILYCIWSVMNPVFGGLTM